MSVTTTRFAALCVLVALTTAAGDLWARSDDGKPRDGARRTWIVRLSEPSLAERAVAADAATTVEAATAGGKGKAPGRRKLDVTSAESQAWLRHLDDDFESVRARARSRFGLEIQAQRRYRVAVNGFSAQLTDAQARQLAQTPGIAGVEPEVIHRMHTDAGPAWINADSVWFGNPGTRGEGVVVGVIDSGIAWDHLSFEDPGENGGLDDYDHQNPFGQQLGLCSQPEVECNDKLIGVYDFVEDNPNTDTVEENNNGYDNTQHGSLVASAVAGNRQFLTVGNAPISVSGVAPNANLVSYRVCYLGDDNDPDDDGCQGSAILDAIDQAVADGVDVINYSLGSNATSPWETTISIAFLNAYQSGIVVVTSAGNAGPADASIGNPGNAPWVTAVGAATHDRIFGTSLATQGGAQALGVLYGASATDQFLPQADIVHAADYGYPLCGTGPEESQPTCDQNTGASNPFTPGELAGKIVVCDRGTYGRVEKGKNVLLAGAVGYVLANTDEWGESIVADEHCLPASHLTLTDADRLRDWLGEGSNHRASISASAAQHDPSKGDRLGDFSSRGPNRPPAENVLKPDLIAPGVGIIGAANQPGLFLTNANGTSFSSPHVAGAAALLKALDPDATPGQITSVLRMTATAELATDENGQPATPFERGSGRPRVDLAAQAGLYMEETAGRFFDADPETGGEPSALNLPAMTETGCADVCSFTRTVRALVPNLTWTVSDANFPDGVQVNVTPSQFNLGAGAQQVLNFEFDLTSANVIGTWVYGEVILSASGRPDAVMPVALFATGGELPSEWRITTDRDGGYQDFSLSGLSSMPQATFLTGGLVRPNRTDAQLVEDPTYDDPYDGGQGVVTVLLDVPQDTLMLHAETLASSARDLDLFVGWDTNGDGLPQIGEEVCSSTTEEDIELCDVFSPSAGTWWVVVQNWETDDVNVDEPEPQAVTLLSAVINGATDSELAATGPGIVLAGDEFDVRVTWDNLGALPGETMLGAVGLASSRTSGPDFGVIPVYLERTGVAEPEARALSDGDVFRFAMQGNDGRDMLFIDVPPGSNSLNVSVAAATALQNDALRLDLYRDGFDTAFSRAPFPDSILKNQGPGAAYRMQDGTNGIGPSITVSGNNLTPGRYYPVVRNQGGSPVSLALSVTLDDNGTQLTLDRGLWQPKDRDIRQGVEYNGGVDSRAIIWYTYRNDGAPTWYLASGATQSGNSWTSDLLRFTNDGATQRGVVVGQVTMSVIGPNALIFSYTLNGESGSEIMRRTDPSGSCPLVSGTPRSYTGLWYKGVSGLGGASVLVNSTAQALIHYLYDGIGEPAWLYADAANGAEQMPILQWSGFCPRCTGTYSNQEVGVLTRHFVNENAGDWTLDYLMATPLAGNIQRTDDVVKLTAPVSCQ